MQLPISNKGETVDEALTTTATGELILPYVVGHNKKDDGMLQMIGVLSPLRR
jgi:hypothetical protein